MEIRSELQQIFRDIFDNDSIVLYDDMSSADIDGWDSLIHMALIMEVKNKFNINFTTNEIIRLRNVGDFVKLINEKLDV